MVRTWDSVFDLIISRTNVSQNRDLYYSKRIYNKLRLRGNQVLSLEISSNRAVDCFGFRLWRPIYQSSLSVFYGL